jgi:hypothetical protein
MGPLSYTWSFTNRLTGQVSPRIVFTTALEEQPMPLDAKAMHARAGRRPLSPLGAPLWPSTSLLPTNTPPLTIHYK